MLGAFGGFAAWCLVCAIGLAPLRALSTTIGSPGDEMHWFVGVGVMALMGVLPPAMSIGAGVFVRDRLLIRAIRDRVTLARCPKCGYSLLGLNTHQDAAQRECVRCPECGTQHTLASLGLTAADLIPRARQQED